MNLKSLLEGMAFGAIIAVGVVALERHRAKPLPPVAPIVHTGPAFSASAEPAQSIEERLKYQLSHDMAAWEHKRDVEFKECDAMHGTPVLGYNGSMICLDSRSVKLVGEPSPKYE